MARTSASETWLHTNEIEEFIGASEYTAELTENVTSNALRWKWLILALHNAVQGACACALRGVDTAGINVLTKQSGSALWRYLDVESRDNPNATWPDERLAPMLELYHRVRNPKYLQEPHRLPDNPRRDADVRRLNGLRNQFIHFVPGGLHVEVSGMPRIVSHCVDVIEHLAVNHPTFGRHLEDDQASRISRALAVIRTAVATYQK